MTVDIPRRVATAHGPMQVVEAHPAPDGRLMLALVVPTDIDCTFWTGALTPDGGADDLQGPLPGMMRMLLDLRARCADEEMSSTDPALVEGGWVDV